MLFEFTLVSRVEIDGEEREEELLAVVRDGGRREARARPVAAADDRVAAGLRGRECGRHVRAVVLCALVVAELVHQDSQRLLVLAHLQAECCISKFKYT